MARGIASVGELGLTSVLVPMADGGEGTVDAFVDSGARRIERNVRGPLGTSVRAAFALDGTTAIVEMAAASGLPLVPEGERDIWRANTYGTGELLRAALDERARRIVVGIGGSATNDGGSGMLAALGARFLDANGSDVAPGPAGLAQLATIDLRELDPRLRDVTIDVAADVDNPLCGPRGASAVFGPQKGASAADVSKLDAALAHFADVAARTIGYDPRDEPGAGAAGGLGYGLRAFLRAAIRPGVEIVAELRNLRACLAGATACFTGEGSIDLQTLSGKTVAGVLALAQAAGVRDIVAFGGRVEPEAARELAKRGARCIALSSPSVTAEEAMRDASRLLEAAAAAAARSLLRN